MNDLLHEVIYKGPVKDLYMILSKNPQLYLWDEMDDISIPFSQLSIKKMRLLRQSFKDYVEKELGLKCALEGILYSRKKTSFVTDHYMRFERTKNSLKFVNLTYDLSIEPQEVTISIFGRTRKYVNSVIELLKRDANILNC